jgi:hypothetical protein
MNLRARILRVTTGTGAPRSLNVLKGLARSDERARFATIIRSMRRKGELVQYGSKRGTTWGAPGFNAGFSTVQIIIITALLSLVLGAVAGVYHLGVSSGRAEMQQKWDNKKLEDARFAAERDRERDKGLLEEQQKRAAAERRAHDVEATAEEAKREARRNGVALVACQKPRPNPNSTATAGGVAGHPPAEDPGAADLPAGGAVAGAPVFTWEFVREFDVGWTALDGQPVSDLAAGDDWARRAGAASPYSAEDIADVADANARACSRDRRELAALIAKIERSAETYDARRQP